MADVSGNKYVAKRCLKVAMPGRKIKDVSPGDVLDRPEAWSQFKTLVKFGHIERLEIPRFRCYECSRDFKDNPGLKRHKTRMH